ncbi:MAG TPA: hypothetical protein VKY73_19910 [Polyangiaceae bacterium]|nr:hypothetical protein [Polyangiaceae bacterium]
MAELKDGTLLFSLKTLMAREDERRALERSRAEREAAVERASFEAAEARRLTLELSRERTQLELVNRERARLARELAELEALRSAESERAQKEAEQRARYELIAQEKAHAHRMAEIRTLTQHHRERAAAVLLGLILVGAIVILVLSHIGPRAELERTRAAWERLLEAERNRASEAARLYREAVESRDALARELERVRAPRATERASGQD